MYELNHVDKYLVNELFYLINKLIKDEKHIYIIKATEFASRKELPNAPCYIINPIIKNIKDSIEHVTKVKFKALSSESEAKLLFEKQFKIQLQLAQENKLEKKFENLLYESYDLCKYDKKFTIEGQEYLYNTNYLLGQYRLHKKALNQWEKENKVKRSVEINFNISHNSNKGHKNQLKVLRSTYNIYQFNPRSYSLEKELEKTLINAYEEDRYMMARSISEICSINYRVKTVENSVSINAFKNIAPYLNSDSVIEKKDIIHSWLTHIAILYLDINPQGIKSTCLAKYINTNIKIIDGYENFKGNAIPIKRLREFSYREISIYNNLRLMQITDNRKKLPYNEKSKKELESFLKNILLYLKKYTPK